MSRRRGSGLQASPAPFGSGEADPFAPRDRSPGVVAGIRQLVACALVFLLSARIPAHLAALFTLLAHPLPDGERSLAGAVLMVALDGFGVLCALYLSHTRLRGVRIWRCYPPQRLIPLSLHFVGLLWGLLSLGAVGGGPGS